jgi:hypothetical protein
MLDFASPAIANSFAGQVGMLDVKRNFFDFSRIYNLSEA